MKPKPRASTKRVASFPRPRNAAATKQAILEAGRAAFARAGYDSVGVREIAKAASVSPMLVNRYFGSKEGLFAAVVLQTMESPHILSHANLASPDVAARFAATLVELTATGATPLDGFQVLVRSAGSERAAEIGRAQIEAGHQRTLEAALRGPHTAERAALVLSLVLGVQMMRQVLRLSPLTDAKPAVLTELLSRMIAPLVRPA